MSMQISWKLNAFLLAWLCVAATVSRAQNASLKGKDLTRVEDAGSITGNLLSGLFGSTDDIDGSIKGVHVTGDVEPELSIQVYYDGFETGWLHAKAQSGASGDREDIRSIRAEPQELDGSGAAIFKLSLDDGAQPTTSTFLELVVSEKRTRTTGQYSLWVLPKEWTSALSAANTVIQVRARQVTYPPSRMSTALDPSTMTDPTIGAVDVRSVRLYHPMTRKYLVAEGGGGGKLVLGSKSDYGSTFQIIASWHNGDPSADGYRATVVLRTEDGFHYVSVPDKDTGVVARLTEPDGSSELTLMHQPRATGNRSTGLNTPKGTYLYRKLPRKKKGRGTVANDQYVAAYDRIGIRARNSEFFKDKEPGAFQITESEREIGGAGVSNRQGPANRPIRPGDLINANGLTDAPELQEFLNIFPDVYPDANPASGIFYFLPNAYYLEWDGDRPALYRTFRMAESDEAEGEVSVSATLEPRVGSAERRLLQVLTQFYAKHNQLPFSSVQAMPVRASQSTTTLGQILGQYDIAAEDVLVTGPTEALGPITVEWTMSSSMMNNLAEVLRSAQGLNAGLTLVPEADLDPRRISLHIRLDDELSFDRIPWENSLRWVNDRPYPVQLKAGHVIVLDASDRPTLTTWDMSSTAPIPPGAAAKFINDLTRNVMNHSIYRWIEYEIIKDEVNTERLLREITGGVAEVEQGELEIRTLNPLEATGAFEIYVQIRSRYLSPSADEIETTDVIVESDRETYTLPFYLGRSDDDTPFEYRVSVMMPDGTEHVGKNWLPGSSRLRIAIGPRQIEDSVGFMPSED